MSDTEITEEQKNQLIFELGQSQAEIKRLELALDEARMINCEKNEMLFAVRGVLVLIRAQAYKINSHCDAVNIVNLADGCLCVMAMADEPSKKQ